MHTSVEVKKTRKWAKNWARNKGWLILFTTTSTLVCCVIPIVLVSLGLGAVVAAVYASVPFLSFLGFHKDWVFIITAVILLLAAWSLYRSSRICPADPELAKACASSYKWNTRLFWMSIVIWSISFFTAYLLLPVSIWLGIF